MSTLGRVASDVSLWRNVKATASRPSDLSKIRAFLGPHTTSLHILGLVTHKPIKRLNRCAALPKGSVTWITEAFCQTLKLRCTRLKRLTLSNCFVDFRSGRLLHSCVFLQSVIRVKRSFLQTHLFFVSIVSWTLSWDLSTTATQS